MAYDGNGNFNRLYNWQDDAANGINIMADRMDNEMNGFAQGLSICFLRDGQTAMEADLDVGNNKLIRVATPVNDTDGVNKKWVEDNFLESAGNPSIEDPTPWLFFKETDQIDDLNQWRIGVNSTAFQIQPLQSDGSYNSNFGLFEITRNASGALNFSLKGQSETNVLVGGTAEGSPRLRFSRATVPSTHTNVISRALASVSGDEDWLMYGDTAWDRVQFLADSGGRFDFYCGTGNLDAAINSNGFYMFGGNGLATTGKGLFSATIDPDTLAVTNGVLVDHGGSNGYVANLDVGALDIRVGGSGTSETVASFNADKTSTFNGSTTVSGQVITTGNGTNAAPAFVVGSTGFNNGIFNDTGGRLAFGVAGAQAARVDPVGTSSPATNTMDSG